MSYEAPTPKPGGVINQTIYYSSGNSNTLFGYPASQMVVHSPPYPSPMTTRFLPIDYVPMVVLREGGVLQLLANVAESCGIYPVEWVISGGFARYVISPGVGGPPIPTSDIDIFVEDDRVYRAFEQLFSGYLTVATPMSLRFRIPMIMNYDINLIRPVDGVYGTTSSANLTTLMAGFPFELTRGLLIPDAGSTCGFAAYARIQLLNDERRGIIDIKDDVQCPVTAMRHATKYIAKGYTLSPDSLKNVFSVFDQMPPEYKVAAMTNKLDYVALGYLPTKQSMPSATLAPYPDPTEPF